MSEPSAHAARAARGPRRSWVVVLLAYAVFLVCGGGLGGFFFHSCSRAVAIAEARDAFVKPLAAGALADAYRELSPARRQAMSFAAFVGFIDHPVLLALDEGIYLRPEEHHVPCTRGSIARPDGSWKVQLSFMWAEDRWWVHGIAMQRPAFAHLHAMLPECGYGQQSTFGYGGPPIERATP